MKSYPEPALSFSHKLDSGAELVVEVFDPEVPKLSAFWTLTRTVEGRAALVRSGEAATREQGAEDAHDAVSDWIQTIER